MQTGRERGKEKSVRSIQGLEAGRLALRKFHSFSMSDLNLFDSFSLSCEIAFVKRRFCIGGGWVKGKLHFEGDDAKRQAKKLESVGGKRVT